MKRIISMCLVMGVVVGMAGNASAYISSSAAYDAENLWMGPGWEKGVSTLAFTLDLDPKVGVSLTDAFLILSFGDDAGRYDFCEFARVSDGTDWSSFEVNTGNYIIPISQDGLTALNAKGELTFTLERLFGDFTFRSARLVAQETNPVPIPGAVWLFGPALGALFCLRRPWSQPAAA